MVHVLPDLDEGSKNVICPLIKLHSHYNPILPLSPDPSIRVKAKSRRLKLDQVDYWEGALQLLFYKLCLKMIDHRSRRTWGPGPSRSRLVIRKCDPPPLKWGCPTTFVL